MVSIRVREWGKNKFAAVSDIKGSGLRSRLMAERCEESAPPGMGEEEEGWHLCGLSDLKGQEMA